MTYSTTTPRIEPLMQRHLLWKASSLELADSPPLSMMKKLIQLIMCLFSFLGRHHVLRGDTPSHLFVAYHHGTLDPIRVFLTLSIVEHGSTSKVLTP